ncbi:uncharacterized protein LOC106135568 [Amyelois transitella]|uniref:uncharacterized protein LOC106135568 n=1 Tax=Amyelois transitella TaxID=680683 RepID=UPI00067AF018|nr:uncharacterized protein LOC106135568 [Amyelois transitella]
MDVYMKNYFEVVFSNFDRDCLNERYKRRNLVEFFRAVIVGCARGENKSDTTSCTNLILATLQYHKQCKYDNGGVCLMGKYHNVLYIAMKLAFDWGVQDTEAVAELLNEIYTCENTFERIFLGAIFGTAAPHFIAGWKSDFLDREENVHALVYFLDHANKGSLEYTEDEKVYRFIDVPLESCGKASPAKVVIQKASSEMLMILLRFGAKITDDAATNPVESILERMKEYKRAYPYELVGCLKLILRVIPTIKFTVPRQVYKQLELPEDYNYDRKIVLENYAVFLEDHLIPSTRCGLRPVELKHLCRCAVRQRLWENFELPFGIYKLPVPVSLKKYLDLFDD